MSTAKLNWEKTFKSNPDDELSVSATYMGIDFHVELQEDGRYLLSVMIHGALYGLGTMAIRQRAIDKMEKVFAEMLVDPSDTMRIAEKYSKDMSYKPNQDDLAMRHEVLEAMKKNDLAILEQHKRHWKGDDLQEQTLAHIIIDAEKVGLKFMGDGMIGYKFVDGTRESVRVWNLILGEFIPEGFGFTEEFFECYGIAPAQFDSEKWNEGYGTKF